VVSNSEAVGTILAANHPEVTESQEAALAKAGNPNVPAVMSVSGKMAIGETLSIIVQAMFEHDGTGNTKKDALTGTGGTELFMVDNHYDSNLVNADVIVGFNCAQHDKIDLPDADFSSGTPTVFYEIMNALTDDDTLETFLYRTPDKTEVIAIIDIADFVPEAGDFLDAGIILQEIT
jgi:hypothetical protein